jgi:hypothetical protein
MRWLTALRADIFCVSVISKRWSSRSPAKASILIGCGAISLISIVELSASRYLRGYEARYWQGITENRQRVAEYRRPLLAGESLDQNAAVWYRLAFTKTALQPADAAQTLGAAVKAGAHDDSSGHSQLLREHCGELRSARVQHALACTHCNWELGYRVYDDSAFDSFSQALILADCLIIDGYEQEREGHATSAAQRYVNALSFACDLGAGDFNMNLAGHSFARKALSALGQLISSVPDDEQALADISEMLVKFQHSLPSVKRSFQMEGLRLENGLAVEAQDYLAERPTVIGYLMPRRTFAVWRLSRADAVLSDLLQAADVRDPERRAQVEHDVEARAAVSDSVIIRDGVRDHWLSCLLMDEDLARQYRAVQAAIPLRQQIRH